MTITSKPSIKDGCLMVRSKVVLTRVPENIIVSPLHDCTSAAFIGATQTTPNSRHVFSLGILEEFKLLTLFKFKIWWMIPRVGKSASEIPLETQMLLLEVTEGSALHYDISPDPSSTENTTFYFLFLPVLDGLFRSSLQGTRENELQLCIESGDTNIQTSQALEALFVNSGDNPFELIKNSIKILEKNKGTFSHIDNKKIPEHLDWFGWCTWDAFYKEVNPQRIQEGLRSLQEGGCSPKFLIIDDGWQDTINEFHIEGEPLVEETQFATRLVDIKEDSKFKSLGLGNTYADLHEFVNDMKEKYGVKLIYMWHALAGYWGGVLPSSETMKKYNPKIAYPIQSPGNVGNLRDIAMDSLEKYGVGVIDPKMVFEFYNDLHGYLASCGINGVKVDVQNVLETLGSRYGGRVLMTRRYQEALEESIAQNFKGNNLICCMSHNSDSLYSSKKSAVARASEDFMPREPTFQTLHVASVAFNSLLLGEIVVPDWDMFHSKHETAEFHAAARALGGCAVYVSDKPGNHDIEVLKKLVLPDGSVLRARYAGRPTRDCLFEDPVMDGKSLLKIWNLNKLSGIVGVFNCQGVGCWPLKQLAEDSSNRVSRFSCMSGHLSPLDVEFLGEIAGEKWNGNCAVYDFNSGSLSILPRNGKLKVTLATLKSEIYTVSPIQVFGHGVHFAPFGLLNMYNSGGALESLRCKGQVLGCSIKIRVRGVGKFGAYSSSKPRYCMIGMKEEEFTYNSDDKLLTVKLQDDCNPRDVEFVY